MKASMSRKLRSRLFWAGAARRANIPSDWAAFSAKKRTSSPSFTRSRRAARWKPASAGGDARPRRMPGAPKRFLDFKLADRNMADRKITDRNIADRKMGTSSLKRGERNAKSKREI